MHRKRTWSRASLRAHVIGIALLIAGGNVACGGSSPTQPSPSPSPSPSVTVVYSTLNAADSRNSLGLYDSLTYINDLGVPVDGVWVVDDFTPSVSAQVRVVNWQGGYCDPRLNVPLAVPASVAQSFRITVAEDAGGTLPLRCPWWRAGGTG
jgi:hypothetical protein